MPDVAFKDLCIDVTDSDGRAAAVTAFWSAALGQPVVEHDDGGAHLGPPEGGPKQRVVWIHPVPEPIAGKSRVHIDLRVAGGDPAPLLAAGATMERPRDDEITWDILNDPDGVALCGVRAAPCRSLRARAVRVGLVAAGATLLRAKDDEIRWWVMADPEGNEFCAFE